MTRAKKTMTKDEQPPPETLAKRAARAAKAAAEAADMRTDADESARLGWHDHAASSRAIAGCYEREAAELNTVPGELVRGTGGEVAIKNPLPPPRDGEAHIFLDTLEYPDSTAAAASRARMSQALALGHDVLSQAIDAAATLGAANALERMAAHQMAALHHLGMKCLADGADMVRQGKQNDTWKGKTFFNVEGSRLMATAARMFATYQNGLATLARVRQGGKQIVTVQHVNVADGGQAVVTGNVTPGGVPPGVKAGS